MQLLVLAATKAAQAFVPCSAMPFPRNVVHPTKIETQGGFSERADTLTRLSPDLLQLLTVRTRTITGELQRDRPKNTREGAQFLLARRSVANKKNNRRVGQTMVVVPNCGIGHYRSTNDINEQ